MLSFLLFVALVVRAAHPVFQAEGVSGSSSAITTPIKHVLLFGDSYTDQSRSHSISNGSFPGPHYQEIYPPTDTAADGGFQWPFYLGIYGNLTVWNYACGGAVCNNSLTPLFGVPDVVGGQFDWFLGDHARGGNVTRMDLNPAEVLASIFIGTNDIGIHSFITDDQPLTTSLSDLVQCQFQAIRNLHRYGVRKFVIQSMIPLHLTRLYAPVDQGTIYWPDVHNGTAWNKRAFNFVNTINAMIRVRISEIKMQLDGIERLDYFDTYAFFEGMYYHPVNFFNGSLPANVTGHCHQCPNATDYHFCGIGDCTLDQRDSYMWWDELHPSEQTGRNLAKEMLRKIHGVSIY